MSNSFDPSSASDETGAIGLDLTASDIAKIIGSALASVALAVGVTAAVMLL